MAQLPEGCRTAFVLHDVEGLEHREVAEMLGIAEGTSKSQVHKARLRLRAMLGGGREPARAWQDVIVDACERYLNAIHELVDGTLGPIRRAELELHLESCEGCRALADDLRAIAARPRVRSTSCSRPSASGSRSPGACAPSAA